MENTLKFNKVSAQNRKTMQGFGGNGKIVATIGPIFDDQVKNGKGSENPTIQTP